MLLFRQVLQSLKTGVSVQLSFYRCFGNFVCIRHLFARICQQGSTLYVCVCFWIIHQVLARLMTVHNNQFLCKERERESILEFANLTLRDSLRPQLDDVSCRLGNALSTLRPLFHYVALQLACHWRLNEAHLSSIKCVVVYIAYIACCCCILRLCFLNSFSREGTVYVRIDISRWVSRYSVGAQLLLATHVDSSILSLAPFVISCASLTENWLSSLSLKQTPESCYPSTKICRLILCTICNRETWWWTCFYLVMWYILLQRIYKQKKGRERI